MIMDWKHWTIKNHLITCHNIHLAYTFIILLTVTRKQCWNDFEIWQLNILIFFIADLKVRIRLSSCEFDCQSSRLTQDIHVFPSNVQHMNPEQGVIYEDCMHVSKKIISKDWGLFQETTMHYSQEKLR